MLDSNVQPLMLGKVAMDGLGLINVNFKPCPYQILTSMGGSKKVQRLAKPKMVI
jgi:hypothetical protein